VAERVLLAYLVLLVRMDLTARLRRWLRLVAAAARGNTGLPATVVLVAVPVMRLVRVRVLLDRAMTVVLMAHIFVQAAAVVLVLLVKTHKPMALMRAVTVVTVWRFLGWPMQSGQHWVSATAVVEAVTLLAVAVVVVTLIGAVEEAMVDLAAVEQVEAELLIMATTVLAVPLTLVAEVAVQPPNNTARRAVLAVLGWW